jgi:hypothetical protein
MKNLETWEELRILAYIFTIIGAVLFLIGVYFDAASFGVSAQSPSVIAFVGVTIKDTGTVCGMLGGGLAYLTEGMK